MNSAATSLACAWGGVSDRALAPVPGPPLSSAEGGAALTCPVQPGQCGACSQERQRRPARSARHVARGKVPRGQPCTSSASSPVPSSPPHGLRRPRLAPGGQWVDGNRGCRASSS